MSQGTWYEKGLSFACTRCGHCCSGSPGHVWVSIAEVDRLATRFSVSIQEFGRKYLRMVGSRLSLIESRGGDCVFWDAQAGCQVYEDRPDQCRSWPFWYANVSSAEDWENAARHCPGCNSGPLHDLVQIRERLRQAPDRPGWPDDEASE